ncbi:30S ribosomal protein S24e [Candidatus Micrarchaeota archaeon]|nr:30S ribosomal protein S24e [Candidatus Micrarchaeota archaeon]
MDAKITKKKENLLLGRDEVLVAIEFEKATPTRKEVKDLVCGKIGANPETVVIREVKHKFGIKEVDILLHVYKDKETMASVEPHYVLVREGMAQKKEKKKKGAAPESKKK